MKEIVKVLGKVALTAEGYWNPEKNYSRLSIVTDKRNRIGYISRKDVPSGIQIDDFEYWQPFNITGYAESNIIQIPPFDENNNPAPTTLENAINAIAPVGRKAGIIVSFYQLNEELKTASFESYQFNSVDISNWTNIDYWTNIKAARGANKGWFKDYTTLNKTYPKPTLGDYAYIGEGANYTQVAHCYDGKTWELYDA